VVAQMNFVSYIITHVSDIMKYFINFLSRHSPSPSYLLIQAEQCVVNVFI
jgi:hypothetical protein